MKIVFKSLGNKVQGLDILIKLLASSLAVI